MSEQVDLPQKLKDHVLNVGSSVSPDDIDGYRQWMEIHDKSHKLREVLDAWKSQQNDDRGMRKTYAYWLLGAMFAQLAIVDGVVIAVGLGGVTLTDATLSTFIASVFGQLAAMVFFITKYLFPKIGKEVLDLIEKL